MYDEILARVRTRIRERVEDATPREKLIERAFVSISDEMNPYMTANEEPVSRAMVETAYAEADADPLTHDVRALAIKMVEHAVKTDGHVDNVIASGTFWTYLGTGPVYEHPAAVLARSALLAAWRTFPMPLVNGVTQLHRDALALLQSHWNPEP